MLTKILVGVVLVLVVVSAAMAWLWNHERRSHRDSVLRLENERAAQDSTHREVVAMKDGEVAVATRLAFQRQVQLDSALRRAARAEGRCSAPCSGSGC